MAMFQFETGLRIGEICAVKETDIEGRYIHIQRQEVREFEKVNGYKMRFKCFKINSFTFAQSFALNAVKISLCSFMID